MDVAQLLLTAWTAKQTDTRKKGLALDVARRSRAAVRLRVGDRTDSMGRPETRGYVRARAALIVHRETGRRLANMVGLSAATRGQIIRTATEHVVDMVLRDLARDQRRQTAPRKAAA